MYADELFVDNGRRSPKRALASSKQPNRPNQMVELAVANRRFPGYAAVCVVELFDRLLLPRRFVE